jgi:filamentous hemagglutinin family protein
MKQFWLRLPALGSVTLFSIFLSIPVVAQIAPDRTTSTTVNREGNNFTIRNGDRAGGNLFHSFARFSVPTNGSAFFDNAPDVVNIINRVTGGNISNIDGLIRSLGSANLFLINPAGIILGPNARLNIGGSFLGSTADSLLFDDGTEFSATDTQTPILTINAPIGLNLRDNPQPITNRSVGNGLQVATGETITLVGGNVNLDGGRIFAPGGRVELGGLSAAGEVGINTDGSLSFPENITRGNVTLTNGSRVDVRGDGGGFLTINARNLELSEASGLLAGIAANLGSPEAQAGDITLNATEAIAINQGSQVVNQINPNAIGISGNINIKAGSFSLSDEGSFINSSSVGQGDAGNVAIDVDGDVTISGTNVINTSTFTLTNGIVANSVGQGNGGNVTIAADGTISLFSGLIISVVTNEGVGNGGDVNLIANGDITLSSGGIIQSLGIVGGNITLESKGNISVASSSDSGSFIASSSNPALTKPMELEQSGDINLTAASLSLINQGTETEAFISNFSSGANIEPGDINIDVEDTVTINGLGSSIGSNSQENTPGRNGDINLETSSLVIQNGGGLSSNTILGEANRGEKGGDINITADFLSIVDGGRINTVASGVDVESGNINIRVSDTTTLEGLRSLPNQNIPFLINQITSLLRENTTGRSGNISLETGSLTLQDGAQISSISLGQGDGGDIKIQAEDRIRLEGGANLGNIDVIVGNIPISSNFSATSLSSSALSLGNGGDIEIDANSLEIVKGAQIGSFVFGQGNAGDIDISIQGAISLAGTTPVIFNDVLADTSSSISSQTGLSNVTGLGGATGNSGTINIRANSFSLNDGAVVSTATLAQGNAGNILIQVDDSISLGNKSSIFSPVFPGGSGRSGDIDIQTSTLTLTGGSIIAADLEETSLGLPSVTGEGGDITIRATDSVNISGFSSDLSTFVNPFNPLETAERGFVSSGLFVNAGEGTTGNAGTITVETGVLRLADGGVIQASTANESNAGDINIKADSFEAINGGQILAITQSSGNGGNINLNIADDITITGSDPTFDQRIAQRPDNVVNQGAESAILALSTAESTGDAGNITINSGDFTIADNGRVTVDSQGQGNGGLISITANELTLNSEGSISASTIAGQGGEILLTIDDSVVLRDNSSITAQAFADANGGNIDIDAEFIIAFPNQNNDIIASAEQGLGGNIDITGERVFGLEERKDNPFTETNDIDASSQFGFDGTVSINTPDVGTLQETAKTPENLVESDRVLGGICNSSKVIEDILADRESGLIIKGRGGLPRQPTDPLSADLIHIEGRNVEAEEQAVGVQGLRPGSREQEAGSVETRRGLQGAESSSAHSPSSIASVQEQGEEVEELEEEEKFVIVTERTEDINPDDIIPARGMIVKPNGDIILTGYPTPNVAVRTPNNPVNCGK